MRLWVGTWMPKDLDSSDWPGDVVPGDSTTGQLPAEILQSPSKPLGGVVAGYFQHAQVLYSNVLAEGSEVYVSFSWWQVILGLSGVVQVKPYEELPIPLQILTGSGQPQDLLSVRVPSVMPVPESARPELFKEERELKEIW